MYCVGDWARAKLAESDYAGGFSLRQAYRHANEPRRFAAALFQEALAELGIKVVPDDIPWGTFIDAQRNFDTAYDMTSHWLNIPIPYSGEMLFRLNHSSLIDTGSGQLGLDGPFSRAICHLHLRPAARRSGKVAFDAACRQR